MGVRGKLFIASLFLIGVSLGAVYMYLTYALEVDLGTRIGAEIESRAALIESRVSSSTHSLDDIAASDALADELGRRARLRVTIIRKDGVVIGDSEVDTKDLEKLENHADRPEVVAALSRGAGRHTRLSTTAKTSMMYLALPFRRAGEIRGVARIAMPLTEVDDARRSLSHTILVGTAAGVALAFLMSWFGAQWLGRRVVPIVETARRMQAGDLKARTRLGGGDELGEVGVALDGLATNLSKAMNDLTRERDLLSSVLEGMREGVLLLDAAGDIALMNPALREMLMLRADGVGKPLLEIVRNSELKELIDNVRGAGIAKTEEIDLGGLSPKRALVRAAPTRTPQRGLLAVVVDVTELRRLESLRRDFVANVSHELRTPVAAVLSAAETLRNGAISDVEAAPRFVDIVMRNATRLKQLIEDLLELSRIESRAVKLKPEAVEVEPLVRGVFAMVHDRASQKQIQLSLSTTPGAETVVADRRALEQILTNLIDNAVKYCGDGAVIRVSSHTLGTSWELTVADNGPGVSPTHLPRLFERFYRVDAGRSRDLGGTGLGLAIVKHLSEAMGATIDVKSVVGEGTSFTVSIPKVQGGD